MIARVPALDTSHKALLQASGQPSGAVRLKWCGKSDSMTYAGGSPGVRAGGGTHEVIFSGDYALVHDTPRVRPETTGAGAPGAPRSLSPAIPGACPAGGVHDTSRSADYSLMSDSRDSFLMSAVSGAMSLQPGDAYLDQGRELGIVVHSFDTDPLTATISFANIQNKWNWCDKCQGLVYDIAGSAGVCPAGGGHDDGSIDVGSYMLLLGPPRRPRPGTTIGDALQASRWRSRAIRRGPPAGGTHEPNLSADYTLPTG